MARITVEDCLEKVPNRFALVILGSKRTKQLLTGSRATIDNESANKPVVTALREVAHGTVRFMTEDEAVAERERIAQLEAEQRAKEVQPASGGIAPDASATTIPADFGADLFKAPPTIEPEGEAGGESTPEVGAEPNGNDEESAAPAAGDTGDDDERDVE